MVKLPRFDRGILKQVRRLVRSRCCNFDHGNCLALDDGEACCCPQFDALTLNCQWFRSAVLPNDQALEAAILASWPNKRCSVCGKPFYSSSNRAKYCPACAQIVRKRKEAERLHKHYLKSRI